MKKLTAIIFSLVFAVSVILFVSSCNTENIPTAEQTTIETTSSSSVETYEVTSDTTVTESVTTETAGPEFEIQDGVLVSYTGDSAELRIPDGVRVIGSYAFKDKTSLASVVVPKGVTVLQPYAFSGCSSLRSMTFEEQSGWGVAINEGDNPFAIDVTIPVSNALSARGNYLKFYWIRTEKEETTTETTVETETETTTEETTEPVVQYELIYLENDYNGYADISMGMNKAEVRAVLGGNPYEETSSKFVYYTQNKNEINSEYGTLTIDFENGKVKQVEYIFGRKIVYVKGTESYYIVNPGITEICDGAFRTNYALVSVTIPDTVTRIGREAFMGLGGLGAVVIGDGVEVIGKDAFRGCTGLKAVYIYDVNFWCGIDFENLFSNPLGYAHNLYVNSNLVSSISIISPVTSISDFAFFNCYSIKEVTVHSLVTKIGQSAFFGCKNLNNVVFKTQSGWRIATTTDYFDGVTVDTTDSAQSAVFLTTAYMSYYWYNNGERDQTQRMKDDFNEYTAIKVGDTLDDVVRLVDSESYQYVALTGAYIWYSEGYYEGDRYNVLTVNFENGKVTGVMFTKEGELVYCSLKSSSITIPSYVKVIGADAFANNKSLVEINLHDNVTMIDDRAFSNCVNLTTIRFGSGLERIGDFAFEKCISLAKIELPGRLAEIGRGAFSGTEALYWVDFGFKQNWYVSTVKGASQSGPYSVPVTVSYQGIVAGSLNNIYVNYYWYCSTPVIGHIKDDYKGYENISLGMTLDQVNELIGFFSDRYASNMGFWYTEEYDPMSTENTMLIVTFKNDAVCEVSFVLKGKLVYWDGNSTTVNVTNRATSIGENVFSGYEQIETVIIPSSITSIGSKAFYRCTGLVSVTIGANVTKIDQNAFGGCTSLGTVKFNNAEGWHVTTYSNYTSGFALDVSLPSLNSFYLSSEYCYHYWYR